MTDARAQRRRLLVLLLVLLGVAFVVSGVAAYLLLGRSVVAGWIVAAISLATAAAALVRFGRYTDAATRRLYPPGQLGLVWVSLCCLAALSQAPTFTALTLMDWS